MPISDKDFKSHKIHTSFDKLEKYARQWSSDRNIDALIQKYIHPYKQALNGIPLDLLSIEKLDEISEYVDFIVAGAEAIRGYGHHREVFYKLADNYANYLVKLQSVKEDQLQNTIDDFQQALQWVDKQNKRAETIIFDLTKKAEQAQQEIRNLESEESEQVVAQTYNGEARKEEKRARFWLWIGAACILGALLNALIVLYGLDLLNISDTEGTAESTLIQIFPISLFLLTGAGISAGFAKFHRNNEKEAKRTALEMSAIQPFIAPLEEKDKKDIIKALALKYFARENSGSSAQLDNSFIEKFVELIKSKN